MREGGNLNGFSATCGPLPLEIGFALGLVQLPHNSVDATVGFADDADHHAVGNARGQPISVAYITRFNTHLIFAWGTDDAGLSFFDLHFGFAQRTFYVCDLVPIEREACDLFLVYLDDNPITLAKNCSPVGNKHYVKSEQRHDKNFIS